MKLVENPARLALLLLTTAGTLRGQELPSAAERLKVEIAATTSEIRSRCTHADAENRTALSRDELRWSDSARVRDDLESWRALGCTRALLYAIDATGREGLLMSVGDSWLKGSLAALMRALERAPSDDASAELLGTLALAEENVAEPVGGIASTLFRAASSGARGKATLRACTAFTLLARNTAASTECADRGLAIGVDSVWHLLHHARMAFRRADLVAGQRWFTRAIGSARDSADWAEVTWHLSWFLDPAEAMAWRGLENAERPTWIRDRLASRDVRDGRPPGTRIAEHFARLDRSDSLYRRRLTRRGLTRFEVASTPENELGYGWVAKWVEPAVVPAQPWRFYQGQHPEYDDRAAIWMRWGTPDKLIPWTGSMHLSSSTDSNGYCDSGLVEHAAPEYGIQMCHPIGSHHNVREVWLYRVEQGGMLVHFEGEKFDGSEEATRLVAGVLGSYLCDVDSRRCSLTNRATAIPRMPSFPPLNPETVGQLRLQDEAMMERATTNDDNALRVEHPIATVAQLARVWDPASGAMLAVVPYAVRVGDVLRDEDSTGITATMAVTLRQWDPGSAEWQSTDFVRRLRLPDRLRNNAHLTGFLVTPSTPGTGAWSLVVAQGDAYRGRAWADRLPSLGGSALRLSDLVLGAASQGQSWTTTRGTVVPLGPLGAFDKDEPVSLYWQVRSESAHEQAHVTIALHEVGARGDSRPALEVTFEGRIGAGLTEWQRDLGVERLDGGAYRVEVVVRAGEATVRRMGRLLLR